MSRDMDGASYMDIDQYDSNYAYQTTKRGKEELSGFIKYVSIYFMCYISYHIQINQSFIHKSKHNSLKSNLKLCDEIK